MKLILYYDNKAEKHSLYLTAYLLNHFKILKLDLIDFFYQLLEKALVEDDNNAIITKSYINYSKAAKIIWCILKKSKKYIHISFIDIKVELANEDPALTAILFGILNVLILILIILMDEKINIDNYKITIVPNFNYKKTNISLLSTIKINSIFFILSYIRIKRRLKYDD